MTQPAKGIDSPDLLTRGRDVKVVDECVRVGQGVYRCGEASCKGYSTNGAVVGRGEELLNEKSCSERTETAGESAYCISPRGIHLQTTNRTPLMHLHPPHLPRPTPPVPNDPSRVILRIILGLLLNMPIPMRRFLLGLISRIRIPDTDDTALVSAEDEDSFRVRVYRERVDSFSVWFSRAEER